MHTEYLFRDQTKEYLESLSINANTAIAASKSTRPAKSCPKPQLARDPLLRPRAHPGPNQTARRRYRSKAPVHIYINLGEAAMIGHHVNQFARARAKPRSPEKRRAYFPQEYSIWGLAALFPAPAGPVH